MTEDLLMDLADCGSPETLLAALFNHYPDLPRKVPLRDIATDVGITDFKELDSEQFEGGLTANAEKTRGVILTRRGAHRRRKRFTIGHELGHFLIRSHRGTQTCSLGDMRERRRNTKYRRQELEANRFSAGLLMPKPKFTKDLEALGSPDVTHIKHLSELYDASMEAAANRYVDLTSDFCAVVFSKDGVIRYARPSSDFPRLSVWHGDTLPNGCLAQQGGSVDGVSDWQEQDGRLWLANNGRGFIPPVLEQCAIQSNGYRVTLLYLEPHALEELEEDEQLEESWEFGFKK